jgi:hypothetical protein
MDTPNHPSDVITDLLTDACREEPEPFWASAQMQGMDGYDVMDPARRHGWKPITGWDRDGWDLGSCPLVVIYHRDRAGRHEVAEYVEGDISIHAYPTAEQRDRATDQMALFHWHHEQEPWVAGITDVTTAPHLCGAYRRERSALETPARRVSDGGLGL